MNKNPNHKIHFIMCLHVIHNMNMCIYHLTHVKYIQYRYMTYVYVCRYIYINKYNMHNMYITHLM